MPKLQKVRISILFIFTSTIVSVGLSGQDNEKNQNIVRARVNDSESNKPVSFARVINKNRHLVVFSDTLGVFSITAYPHDTLFISSIGYYSMSIKVTDTLFKQTKIPVLKLIEHVYELGMVNVNSFGTYQQFKYKVLHVQIPTNTTQQVIESIQKELALIPKHPLQAEASIPLGSPVTALYMLFSKEGKSLRHYKKVLEEEKSKGEDEKSLSIVSKKYNAQIVSQVTGLTGDQLTQFMLFCRPNNMFIVISNDYEVYKQILDCYTDYKRTLSDHKLLTK